MAKSKRKKGPRNVIGMKCKTCSIVNYITTKNKTNTPDKIKLDKYCPQCKKTTTHAETSQLK